MQKRIISLFAGIGGFDLGFQQSGFTTVAHVERDPQCRKLLYAKFPQAHAFYDVNEATGMNLPTCDVLCGGWPCQDLSVAGKRAGLAGARSGLFYQFTRIANELQPAFIVWENVPGLLSSDNGRDMCRVLMEFQRIGYSGCWRTLDAQYLGVAQRRRRVFGVFARRDIGAECCAEILSIPEGMCGHPAPRREAGKEVAGTIGGSSQSGGFRTTDLDNNGAFVVAGALDTNDRGATADKAAAGHYVCARSSGPGFWSEDDQAAALGTAARAVHESTLVAHTLRGEGFDASEDGTGRGTPLVAVSVALRGREGGAAAELGDECGNALRASQGGGDKAYVLSFLGRMSGTQCASAEDISISLSAENPAAVAFCNSKLETFTDKGIIRNASTQETHTDTILRILRKEIGEEEFAEWGLGILVPFYPPEVLQSALHGSSLRPAPFPGDWMVHISSPCPKKRAEGALRTVRSAECDGCSSPGSKLSEQLAEELGTYLSFLSQPGASQEIVMRDLWIASEGIGLLREALSAIQKAWESYVGKSESVLQPSGVRRLSPEECEFLQGFPRGYTAGFADSTRYRMLGNAVAVPVTRWIATRLAKFL